MSDAAAFFKNKKKKKKGFKGFNANKIDAASVTPTVHVDAPALSTDAETSTASATAALAASTLQDTTVSTNDTNNTNNAETGAEGGEWDDEALAATYTRKGATSAGTSATSELLDMKALESKRREQDDVAERLRVEETKAALAAAREGMEREAQRLKEEREKKEEEKKPEASGLGGVGGKWVPPHMRAGSGLSRMRMGAAVGGATQSRKLDTQDENLFPDLAAADAILEQQKQQVAYKVPKKTAVGGGATWGSRPPAIKQEKQEPPKPAPASKSAPSPKTELPKMAPPKTEAPKTTPKDEPSPPTETEQEKAKEEPAPPETPAAPTVSTPAPAPTTAVKKKKKKKKDLSTFKPSG